MIAIICPLVCFPKVYIPSLTFDRSYGMASIVCYSHSVWLFHSLFHRDKQNMARKLACNGLYPCPDIIEATLHHTSETTKQILDLGTSPVRNQSYFLIHPLLNQAVVVVSGMVLYSFVPRVTTTLLGQSKWQ